MFELSDKAKKLQAQLNEFMDAHIYPNESTHHEQIEQAKTAGHRFRSSKN